MAENKTKTTIKTAGDAFVITAGFKFETLTNLTKYGKNEALVLVDKETKDPYFAVTVADMTEISKFGVTFTGANRDGYAECTGHFPMTNMTEDEKRNFLKDNLAFVVTYLNKIQEQVEVEEKALKEIIACVDNAITIN